MGSLVNWFPILSGVAGRTAPILDPETGVITGGLRLQGASVLWDATLAPDDAFVLLDANGGENYILPDVATNLGRILVLFSLASWGGGGTVSCAGTDTFGLGDDTATFTGTGIEVMVLLATTGFGGTYIWLPIISDATLS